MALHFSILLLLLNLHLSTQHQQQASGKLILEEGYTVSTILNGNKLSHPIFPSSLLPTLGGGGPRNLVVLDSPNSAFYTISFPISQDSEIRRLSGNGTSGFADGDLGVAMFDRPRSFAVDLKGNVYVADKTNHAIRKISKSAVTTIAGGHTGKPGNTDGPAQYASFSEDFELTFVPELCALLISDRGNRLIRKLNLKPNDCESGSHWQLGASGSALLGAACLILGSVLTLAIHLVAYPFIIAREIVGNHKFSETWKRCQINLVRQVVTVSSDIKSVVASSTVYLLLGRIAKMSLSHLTLMFNISSIEKQTLCREQVSLLDSDIGCNHKTAIQSEKFADQLKDLIVFDANLDAPEEINGTLEGGDDHEKYDVLTKCNGSLDAMICANVLEFSNQPTERHPLDGVFVGSSGLVKRK